MVQLLRTAAAAEAFNLECEILTPAQAKDRYPILETSDLQGAIWLPLDGTANPTDVTQSLAKGARMLGAKVFERTRVLGFTTVSGAVTGVRTDKGDIEAEIVVNCAGQWAKALGDSVGVTIPLHSAEHFYVVTDQIEGVEPDDAHPARPRRLHLHEGGGGRPRGWRLRAGREALGGARRDPLSVRVPAARGGLGPLRDSHGERAAPGAGAAADGDQEVLQRPGAFTPDNQFILGEAPTLRNYFVAAGFNSVGIASAGGAGKALAEWIVGGEPPSDLVGVDIRRFGTFNGNKQWLRDRVGEVLGLHYAVPWPNREFQTARPFRRSPVHHLVESAGACFGSRMGWERPNFFAPNGADPVIEYSWGKQNWIPWVDDEQRATREAVALFDQTSFGKLLVQGPDAEDVLQWLCTADVAVPVGRTVYTGVLNARGTYEADVTLTRLAHDEYLWVTSSASVVRDRDWIVRHVTAEQDVSVTDVTGALAVLGVMGPRSRDLLQSLSTSDLSAAAFPFGTSQEIDLGSTTVRATRITYVGELGWELYVPAEFAVSVFSMLTDHGRDFGLANAGYYAINALRLEKGYRAFGTELTPDYNPVEAGLMFATKLKTSIPFLGREAVEAARATGVRRRLVSFALADPDIMMWGGELVLRDGVGTGQVTGAAFGTTVGSCVGLAYVWDPEGDVVTDEYLDSGDWTINVGGTLAAARVQRGALYDPKSERIRS